MCFPHSALSFSKSISNYVLIISTFCFPRIKLISAVVLDLPDRGNCKNFQTGQPNGFGSNETWGMPPGNVQEVAWENKFYCMLRKRGRHRSAPQSQDPHRK